MRYELSGTTNSDGIPEQEFFPAEVGLQEWRDSVTNRGLELIWAIEHRWARTHFSVLLPLPHEGL
jgi:hypothetical protein